MFTSTVVLLFPIAIRQTNTRIELNKCTVIRECDAVERSAPEMKLEVRATKYGGSSPMAVPKPDMITSNCTFTRSTSKVLNGLYS